MPNTWEVIETQCLELLGDGAREMGGDYDNVEIIGLAAKIGEIIAITTIQHMSCEMLGYNPQVEKFLKHLRKARCHLVKASDISDSQ